MKNIKNFKDFLNENYNDNKITRGNIVDYKNKIYPVIAGNDNLLKGMKFTIDHIDEYMDSDTVSDIVDVFLNDLNSFILKKKPDFFKEDTGYSGNKFTGKHYDKTSDLSIKEIAKLVREEIAIEFPECKFSIKSTYNTINITVIDIDFNPFNEEYIEFLESGKPKSEWNKDRHWGGRDIFNERYNKFISKLKSIMSQYNMDDSDSQVDYFHTNFYSSISVEEDDFILKFYPDHQETKAKKDQHNKWNAEWEAKKAARKKIADEKKGKFKKGEEVLYIHKKDSWIPAGEYPAIILKSPNGRAMFSTYEIRITTDKKFNSVTNQTIQLDKPRTYEIKVYDNTLKEKN